MINDYLFIMDCAVCWIRYCFVAVQSYLIIRSENLIGSVTDNLSASTLAFKRCHCHVPIHSCICRNVSFHLLLTF